MSDKPHHYQSVTELGRLLRSRELSSVELTQHFLERIERLDPHLNAYRLVCGERALAHARAADAQLGAGTDLGPLHGIPYAAKDLYDVEGLPTCAGTSLLRDNVAARSAAVIDRLHGAGMVLLGKTNTVQFAYGGAGINHDHGTPHNPWHRVAHLPGGSSSGSGVAVAAGLAPMGLGSDTGGSVRIPAAFCSTTGLKTTLGRVSRAGVYPLSWSLDSVGPLCRDASDAALVYHAIHGPDLGDETTLAHAPHDVLGPLSDGVRGLRIAFAKTAFWDEAHPLVADAVRACGAAFESLGTRISSIEFAEAERALELNPRGLVIAAEAYVLNREWLEEHFDALDPVVAFRMIKGKEIPAHDYLRTMRDLTGLRAQARKTMADLDALLCPTIMIPPPTVAEVDRDVHTYSNANLQCLRNTAIGNLLDLCAVTVPCGFTEEGLPIGLMIYAKPFDEAVVLRIGHAFQQVTDWHLRMPALDWIGDA